MSISNNAGFWYRINGYWRSFGVMRTLGFWSERKEQQYRSFLMGQRGKGKSRPMSVYEKLNEPRYRVKWVRAGEASQPKK